MSSTGTAGCPGGLACTCGCCEGVADRTPRALDNRAGLGEIAYRNGTWADFRASLHAGLTGADRPALAKLTTRDDDDFTIGLLDAWAVTADVLTFYTERLAQESYLRTARERISLQELGRLIGYRLRPGVAAETLLAFAVEAPPVAPQLPAGTAPQPGSAPPVTPELVTIPRGLRVQSVPGPGEKPQTFETVEEVAARAAWGAIPAGTTVSGIDATGAWLAGTGLNVRVGDAVTFSAGPSAASTVAHRFLTGVTEDPRTARTRIAWAGAVRFTGTPDCTVYRKRVAVFGHSAPDWRAMSPDFRDDYRDAVDPPILFGGGIGTGGIGNVDIGMGAALGVGDWPHFSVQIGASISGLRLDGEHADIQAGSTVLVAVGGGAPGRWEVAAATSASAAEFAVSGKVTVVDLATGPAATASATPRQIVVFAVPESLAVARRDDPSPVSGYVVEVDEAVDVDGLAAGRRVIVTGRSAAGANVVHATTLDRVERGVFPPPASVGPGPSAYDGRWDLVLHDPLPAPLVRSTVVVHANVALATHGETHGELLGGGTAGETHQHFTLKQEPLTYVQSTDPSGATASLEVRVDDLRWAEVATLYGQDPSARAFAVRVDEQGHTFVQFGDGVSGRRLPSGAHNVRARYRVGLGSAGNVRAGTLANLLDRPLGLKGVSNPSPATGGTDPEPPAVARASIPLAVRTLGRAVSVLDYQDFARSFAGVSKATASVLPLRAGPTVAVTVAFGEEGTDAPGERLVDLKRSLVEHGDPHVEVVVLDHVQVPFRLALKVMVDPAFETAKVLAAVDAALRGAFAFPNRAFGAPVERSAVIAVAHTVAGVIAVDLDLLYVGTTPELAVRLVAPKAGVTPTGEADPRRCAGAGGRPLRRAGGSHMTAMDMAEPT